MFIGANAHWVLGGDQQAEEALEKSKFRTSVEAYNAALEIIPDHNIHNIKLNIGLCKALVKLGRGKDAVTRCTQVLEMEESQEALEQVGFLHCL